MIRKIEKMHLMFGKADGKRCEECNHLLRYRHHDRTVTKCEVYGDTRSEATDWSGRHRACGLYRKEYGGDIHIVRLSISDRADNQIAGQISLFEEGT